MNLTKALNLIQGIEEYTESSLIKNLRKTMARYPEIDFSDAFSRNQIISKVWLKKELLNCFGKDLGAVHILCGWYGLMAAILSDRDEFNIEKIRSIDLDEACVDIADSMNIDWFNNKWKFKAFPADIFDLNYEMVTLKTKNGMGELATLTERNDLLINTSCEHIADFSVWRNMLPEGKKVALQSNDYDLHVQHTNCADSLDDFVEDCRLSKVHFQGEKQFKDYTRFMVIGEV